MVLPLRKSLERHPQATLAALTALAAAAYSSVALHRHHALGSGAFDLGLFANALWNLVQGHGYVSAPKGGLNLLADHASPIGWLFAPLVAAWPDARVLLVAQSLALAAGAWPLLAVARQYRIRDPLHGLGLACVYWLYPPLRAANAFDFHPEVLFLPLALTAVWLCQETSMRRRVAGLAVGVLALGCKESSVATFAGIGLAWTFGAGPAVTRDWTRKLGATVAPLCCALFAWEVTQLPKIFGEAYAYSSGFPASLGEAADRLAQGSRLKFVFGLLAPLALLPVFGGAALWAALPPVLMLLLSPGDHRLSLHYHYGVEPALGLLWGLLRTMRVRGAGDAPLPPVLPSRAKLGWALAVCTALFHGRTELQRAWSYPVTPAVREIHANVLPCLNPRASVATNSSLVPHWAMRPWVHGLDSFTAREGRPVDCVVVDSKLSLWPLEGGEPALVALKQRVAEAGYRRVHAAGSLEVWQHANASLSCWESCSAPRPAISAPEAGAR